MPNEIYSHNKPFIPCNDMGILDGVDLQKSCLTAAGFFSSLTMGMVEMFLSPTLIEFSHRLNTSVGVINSIECVSYVTYLAATFAFGFAFTRMSRYAVLPVILLVVSISLVALPYANNLLSFTIVLNLITISHAAYHSAQMTWMLDLWRDKSGPYIQAENFFGSIGHLMAPLVFAEFLPKISRHNSRSPAKFEESGATTDAYSLIIYNTSSTIEDWGNDSETWQTLNDSYLNGGDAHPELSSVPFEILGGIAVTSAIFQFVVYVSFNEKRDLNTETTAAGSGSQDITPFSYITFKRELPLILLITLAYTGAVACTYSVLHFLPVFACFSKLELSEMSAANLLSFTNAAYVLGSVAGIPLNLKFSSRRILIGNCALIGTGTLLFLYSLGKEDTSQLLAWLSCAIIGLGISTAVPSVSAYGMQNLSFNSVVGAFILNLSTVCVGIGKLVIGAVIEGHPDIFLYSLLILVVLVLLALWGFECLFKRATAKPKESGNELNK